MDIFVAIIFLTLREIGIHYPKYSILQSIPKIERLVAIDLQIICMPRPIQISKNPAVNPRMQRLHQASRHLRDLSILRNLDDMKAELPNSFSSPSGPKHLDLELREYPGQPVEPCFVVDR